MTNVDLPYLFGFRDYLMSAMFGLVVIGGVLCGRLRRASIGGFDATRGRSMVGVSRRRQGILEAWGPVRFGITGFLFIAMIGVVVKMALRHAFNIKYILVTPWINI